MSLDVQIAKLITLLEALQTAVPAPAMDPAPVAEPVLVAAPPRRMPGRPKGSKMGKLAWLNKHWDKVSEAYRMLNTPPYPYIPEVAMALGMSDANLRYLLNKAEDALGIPVPTAKQQRERLMVLRQTGLPARTCVSCGTPLAGQARRHLDGNFYCKEHRLDSIAFRKSIYRKRKKLKVA